MVRFLLKSTLAAVLLFAAVHVVVICRVAVFDPVPRAELFMDGRAVEGDIVARASTFGATWMIYDWDRQYEILLVKGEVTDQPRSSETWSDRLWTAGYDKLMAGQQEKPHRLTSTAFEFGVGWPFRWLTTRGLGAAQHSGALFQHGRGSRSIDVPAGYVSYSTGRPAVHTVLQREIPRGIVGNSVQWKPLGWSVLVFAGLGWTLIVVIETGRRLIAMSRRRCIACGNERTASQWLCGTCEGKRALSPLAAVGPFDGPAGRVPVLLRIGGMAFLAVVTTQTAFIGIGALSKTRPTTELTTDPREPGRVSVGRVDTLGSTTIVYVDRVFDAYASTLRVHDQCLQPYRTVDRLWTNGREQTCRDWPPKANSSGNVPFIHSAFEQGLGWPCRWLVVRGSTRGELSTTIELRGSKTFVTLPIAVGVARARPGTSVRESGPVYKNIGILTGAIGTSIAPWGLLANTLAALAAVTLLDWLFRVLRAWWRVRHSRCRRCGHPTQSDSAICFECGADRFRKRPVTAELDPAT
jgi:RNA polymerase subunit RPABC4/transcription elongation factor Spt4